MRPVSTLNLSAFAFALSIAPADALVGSASRIQSSMSPEARAVDQGPIPRALVRFDLDYAPRTIVVSTTQRRLYLVLPGNQAIRYGVGVGRPGFERSGMHRISRKAERPDWRPSAEMLKRRPDLPRLIEGGEDNPLGARALHLGSSLYRIHGSNEPNTVGQAVSSGCIRMTNEDVADLYDRVPVGVTVVVLR